MCCSSLSVQAWEELPKHRESGRSPAMPCRNAGSLLGAKEGTSLLASLGTSLCFC